MEANLTGFKRVMDQNGYRTVRLPPIESSLFTPNNNSFGLNYIKAEPDMTEYTLPLTNSVSPNSAGRDRNELLTGHQNLGSASTLSTSGFCLPSSDFLVSNLSGRLDPQVSTTSKNTSNVKNSTQDQVELARLQGLLEKARNAHHQSSVPHSFGLPVPVNNPTSSHGLMPSSPLLASLGQQQPTSPSFTNDFVSDVLKQRAQDQMEIRRLRELLHQVCQSQTRLPGPSTYPTSVVSSSGSTITPVQSGKTTNYQSAKSPIGFAGDAVTTTTSGNDNQLTRPTIPGTPSGSSRVSPGKVAYGGASHSYGYTCILCHKSFRHKLSLEAHERTHSGERPFPCTQCEKRFSQKSALATHLKLHSGLKPHKCVICDKAFALENYLKLHMRTHTGERPYSCEICPRAFTQRNALRIHQRTHTGERPFKCSECGKAFIHAGNLRVHERVHTREKPYTCAVCLKTFAQSSSLTTHVKNSHQAKQNRNLLE